MPMTEKEKNVWEEGVAESTVSVCFATWGKRWAWGKLVSIEDRAWVVIVFPLERIVVNMNTTRG